MDQKTIVKKPYIQACPNPLKGDIMKLITVFSLIIIFSTALMASESAERTFYLKSGERVTGEVISIDEDGKYTVQTSFGVVTFNKTEIREDEVKLLLLNGDIIKGAVIEEGDDAFRLLTQFGEITVWKTDIESIDFRREDEPFTKTKDENSRWYFGDERLIDLWFDPVGFTLYENQLYLSGLSWAYGITGRFQVSSKWSDYFFGSLNFRPKYMLYYQGDVGTINAASIGGHIHTRGLPDKHELIEVENEFGDMELSWVRIGAEMDEYGELEDAIDDGDELWYEVFAAYTLSKVRKSGQGRINYNFGSVLTYYPDEDLMTRVFAGIDVDARRNLKLLFELAYDPYYAPFINREENEDTNTDIHFDFGFLYAYNEKLRFGLHFQQPFFAVYYKF